MLYWALDKPHCKHGQALQSLAGVIWQPTWLQPYFQVYKLDRWFVEFIRYKRWLTVSVQYFSLLQLHSSCFFQTLVLACSDPIPVSASSCLSLAPASASSTCLVTPYYFHPGSFLLVQELVFLLPHHGTCWRHCSGVCSLPHPLWGSAIDHTPSSPGNLRCILVNLISGLYHHLSCCFLLGVTMSWVHLECSVPNYRE